MTQILWLWCKQSGSRLFAGLTLSLLLLVSVVTLANGSNSDDPPPSTNGTSGGSRGCDTRTATSTDGISALVLLAPTQQFGQTVATSPTFAWFVRDSGSWPMNFKLYAYNPVSRQAKLVKEIKDANFNSSPGIIVLSIPGSVLSVGQRYIWEVGLICNPDHPSSNPFASAAIKVVQTPPELKTQLSHISEQDIPSKAEIYAKSALWYDTLGLVLTAKDNPRLRKLKSSLLEQVVAGTAAENREREIAKLAESTISQVQR